MGVAAKFFVITIHPKAIADMFSFSVCLGHVEGEDL